METIAAFFGWGQEPEKQHHTSVVISWEHNYYDVDFREFAHGFDEATVRDLKEKCKKLTGVPMAIMKLMASGAYLKDDTATLRSVGVHMGSLVDVIGKKADPYLVRQTASGDPEEYGCLIRIANVVDPMMTSILQNVSDLEDALVTLKSADQDAKRKHSDMIRYISEMLTQHLITLDSVVCPPEFATARLHRKEGVKIAQQLLDRVDRLRADAKQATL